MIVGLGDINRMFREENGLSHAFEKKQGRVKGIKAGKCLPSFSA